MPVCEIENEEENDVSDGDISVTDESPPRGDESLIEWIDRQLKEAEERKKLKETNERDQRRRDYIYRVPEIILLEFAIRCLEMPVLEKKLTGATILQLKIV